MATSTTFLAIYRGTTIGEAHLLAVTTDPVLVRDVVERLLGEQHEAITDPAVRALEDGRHDALQAALPGADDSTATGVR